MPARGELSNAALRAKDLELGWDRTETGLKPCDVAQWHAGDPAIDRALLALRAAWPTVTEVIGNLDALLAAF